MADLNLDVSVNTTQAQRNVQALENRVEKLMGAFNGLRSAIAGLALGALISRSIAYADAIADIADATGLATEKIMGFSQAVTLSGGSSDQANDGLMKLVAAIGEAAEGSTKAQDAFKEVGVSLKDLRTLSEQDIFEKSIQGLAGIEDTAKRAALQAALFGKSFRGINIQNVAQAYGPAIAQQREYAKSVQAAAELQDKLDRTFIRLQASILKAIEPLANFVDKLDEQDIQAFIDAMIKLGTAIGALGAGMIVLEKLGKVLLFAVGIFASAKVAAINFGAAIASIGKTASIAISYITNFFKVTPMFEKAGGAASRLALLFEKLALRLPFLAAGIGGLVAALAGLAKPVLIVAAAIYALNAALKLFSGKNILEWVERLTGFVPSIENVIGAIEKLYRTLGAIASFAPNQLGRILGIESLENAGNIFTGIANKLKGIREGMIDENADNAEIQRLKNKAEGQKEVNEKLAAQAKKQKEIREVADQRARQMAQFTLAQRQELENLQQGLKLDVSRITFQRDLIMTNGQLTRMTEDQVEEATALQQLDEARILAVQRLNQQIQGLRASSAEDANAQAKILVLQQQIRDTNAAYYDQRTKVSDALRGLQAAQYTAKVLEEDRLRTLENITRAYDDQVTRTQTLAGQLKGVGEQINEALFERGQIGKTPISAQIDKIKNDAQKAALEAQRAFAETFGEGDLGPEREAELLKGLDAIKLKYQELAQVQADNVRLNYDYSRSWAAGWGEAFREYMDNATNAATTARDVFSSVTGNMNSAIDNFVNTGKFKFSDFATSVVQDLLKIELKMLASKALSPILSGIGAGVTKLLGFADGGNPPINKPSIVGEKGPELFVPKTAGTIIPNGGLGGQQQVTNNYITNNISAVDAKSVAQLFAENRRTLLGTMRLAEKELSYR